ncbi:MAG: NAD-dependent protein deacylase [Oscillospiraceae bacterium]|nr:NAD-dependent protein deacylase [Oscillospiraceae bacterium]
MDNKKAAILGEWIKQSDNIVFFGGAGVSTESGIPDFRSVDGLYNQKYDYPPEEILSRSFFCNNISEFYRFYKDKMLYAEAAPNRAHVALARLEQCGKLKAVVTQNIDGLHHAAGSHIVYELHGSVHRNYCIECHSCFDADYIRNSDGIPACDKCGHLIKPDVVLYQEGLDSNILNNSIKAISEADMLIVGGTSLSVYPASGLIEYFKGDKLVLINKSTTSYDSHADLLIQDSIGEVLETACEIAGIK